MTPEQFKQVSELSPKWQCEVDQKPLDKIEEIYKSEKKAPEKIPTKLTVGQKFLVTCRGEAQVIDPVKAKIYHSSKQNSPAQDFILKKFENKVWDAKQIQFVAASYLPAKINAPVLIGDGENYIFIENIEFELESVVEQQDIQLGQQQQENPEYPAFGGMKMHKHGLPPFLYRKHWKARLTRFDSFRSVQFQRIESCQYPKHIQNKCTIISYLASVISLSLI